MGRPLTVGAILFALLTGCGGDSSESANDEDQVREAVEQFTALAANGDEGCEEYVSADGALRKAIDSAERLKESTGISLGADSCGYPEKSANQLASLVISRVTVSGDSATVAFDNQVITASVVKEGDEWLVENLE